MLRVEKSSATFALKVLQMNIKMGDFKIEGTVDMIADEIIVSKVDVIFLPILICSTIVYPLQLILMLRSYSRTIFYV